MTLASHDHWTKPSVAAVTRSLALSCSQQRWHAGTSSLTAYAASAALAAAAELEPAALFPAGALLPNTLGM